jgi:metal-dependent amidase/aminoacylase/carboxypeptidase family protein
MCPDMVPTSSFPLLRNDEAVTAKLEESFAAHFQGSGGGDQPRVEYNPSVPFSAFGSEDFGILATSVKRPSCFWTFGGWDVDKWKKAEAEGRLSEDVPGNHSPFFAPVIMPTLQVGCDAYAVAALTWLVKGSVGTGVVGGERKREGEGDGDGDASMAG